jgi:large subunit ribosomal protein L20
MRVKTGTTRHARHKKLLKQTRGFRMTKSRLVKVAKEAVLHAGEYSFVGRKQRKRQFRTLWIQRINAGLSQIEGAPSYSRFIKAMSDKNIVLDRRVLAKLASGQPEVFKAVVEAASQK